MDAGKAGASPTRSQTTVERKSAREVVVTRTFNAPARLVFEAWTKAELFRQWWVPRSMNMNLLSCEMDVRVGGGYRLEFGLGDSGSMAFYGKYLEVTPYSRLVWTNEEGEDGAVTTVTFEESDGQTVLVLRELYPSKEALDAAGTGAAEALVETFGQLDELLAGSAANPPVSR
ncbi:MAG: SRPBCC family protein [Proteobacteria bacterium]|nr:SRPBCC family protein [Pseudomonadota bacterium]